MSTFSTADHQQETERIKKYNFVSTVSHKIDAKDENRYHLEEFFTQLPDNQIPFPVTQDTNLTTTVDPVVYKKHTLITTNSTSSDVSTTAYVQFQFTNTLIHADSIVNVSCISTDSSGVTNEPLHFSVDDITGGSCKITCTNASSGTAVAQVYKLLITIDPQLVTINPNFQIEGTNIATGGTTPTGGIVTYDRVAPGVKLTTNVSLNDSMIIAPRIDLKTTHYQSAWTGALWNTNDELIWECAVQLPSVAENVFWAGLKQTNVDTINADASSAFFRSNGSSLEFIYSNGNAGSDTSKYTTNLGITLTVNKTYRLKIVIDSNRFVSVFVNGTQYGLTTTTGVTGVTQSITNKKSLQLLDANLIPYIGIKTSAAETKDLVVCYEKISRALKDN